MLRRTPLAKVGPQGKENALADRKDRKIVHDRGRVCEYCGQKPAVEVHHVLKKKVYPAFRHVTEIQVDVCWDCHQKADSLIWNLTQFKRIKPEIFAKPEYALQAKLDAAKNRVGIVREVKA